MCKGYMQISYKRTPFVTLRAYKAGFNLLFIKGFGHVQAMAR